MITVDVLFSNRTDPNTLSVRLEQSLAAVIDVIRATSTITVLLASGCESIIVAANKKQAFDLKKKNPGFILCGEEGGLAPKGFDYGNSPLELSKLDLEQKTVILKTTNGTVSLHLAHSCRAGYTLSLLNMAYAINKILDQLQNNGHDLLLICSGQEGRIAYDDVYTAGVAVKYILGYGGSFRFTDSAKMALSLALSEADMESALKKSSSAQALVNIGLEQDIAFCAQLDKYSLGGKLVHDSGLLKIGAI